MKVELKDFQREALRRLFRDAVHARREIVDGEPQALVLAAPTGSGKTVMATALLEAIVQGDDTIRGDPRATFLWLSDMPELNEQSRRRIKETGDVFRDTDLVLVDHETFDREIFAPGKVYFLNTQKLGRDRRLVAAGDERTFTIWQTITNTVRERPSSFWVVLDEAHKGMQESRSARDRATSIVQKFVKGSAGEIPPVPLLVGISATPERFTALLSGISRVRRETIVDPEDVRESGLLKDVVTLFFPDQAKGDTDWTLLGAAASRWGRFAKEWEAYMAAQGLPAPPSPILVVQVEDAASANLSRTDLVVALRVIERAVGPLSDAEVAHSFQEDTPLSLDGRSVRKLRASDIDGDPSVRVVFFKMALSTGWDCPRAEVMMSFRPAADATLIAQLVGRMVRTPLARRIEGNDFLNSVALYLPHYDRPGLLKVVERLKLGDPETLLGISVVEGSKIEELTRATGRETLFSALEAVPSYALSRAPKVSDARRLIRLGRRLNFDEIDLDAGKNARAFVLGLLHEQRERLLRDPTFAEKLAASTTVRLASVAVAPGTWVDAEEDEVETIPVSEENIADVLEWCGRRLGEGLHMDYWRARRAEGVDSQQATLELFYLLRDRSVVKAIEDATKAQFDRVWLASRDARRALPAVKDDAYTAIRGLAVEPETVDHSYDDRIMVSKGERAWERHLYVDGAGLCHLDLNQWEQRTMEAELADGSVEGWLRNFDRKSWSVCIPYRMGGYHAFYPDFLVLRRQDGTLVVDILEPHDPTRDDAWPKAVGLAEYAARHGGGLGRVAYVVAEGAPIYLDVNHAATRAEVLRITSNPHLQAVIRSHGRGRS
ncbi:MAG TPA: DEAD/DEAH box helicase family protein [Chloroflexota bacterium]|nr:DEAD/DEAH box helicase family protein [Chloroflexota bacterium]